MDYLNTNQQTFTIKHEETKIIRHTDEQWTPVYLHMVIILIQLESSLCHFGQQNVTPCRRKDYQNSEIWFRAKTSALKISMYVTLNLFWQCEESPPILMKLFTEDDMYWRPYLPTPNFPICTALRACSFYPHLQQLLLMGIMITISASCPLPPLMWVAKITPGDLHYLQCCCSMTRISQLLAYS